MSDCYYIVTNPVPLADVNTECQDAYGVQSSIIGLGHNTSLDDRMEIYFHLEKLVNVDG